MPNVETGFYRRPAPPLLSAYYVIYLAIPQAPTPA
jgi:hypothetical protein